MEQNIIHLAQGAAWVFLFIFAFAVIGVIATGRWIVDMLNRGERAVEDEAHKIGSSFHRTDDPPQ